MVETGGVLLQGEAGGGGVEGTGRPRQLAAKPFTKSIIIRSFLNINEMQMFTKVFTEVHKIGTGLTCRVAHPITLAFSISLRINSI